MLDLKTAFMIHGVVGVLFCLPILTSGMTGFMKTVTNGELSKPDKFHMNIFGIDFCKNIMIALQCYAGTKMNTEAQKLLAQTFVVMCLCCGATLFIYPTAPIQELVPPLLYLTIVPSCYVLAIMKSGGAKGGKKK